MTVFRSILVPLHGSTPAEGELGCATWLASQLGAKLHVLGAPQQGSPTHDAAVILAAVEEHGVDLVVTSAREQTAASSAELPSITDDVTLEVIERSTVPVLLLPAAYEHVQPWHRLLVPASGGTESDRAIAVSVQLARELDLAVYVAHVSGDDLISDDELCARARYSDALHHEYAGQLEEVVTRSVAALDEDKCRCIRGLIVEQGEVAAELLHVVRRDRICVLVVGWHGELSTGRAEILKHLLPSLDVPILLVKSALPVPFRLRAGEDDLD